MPSGHAADKKESRKGKNSYRRKNLHSLSLSLSLCFSSAFRIAGGCDPIKAYSLSLSLSLSLSITLYFMLTHRIEIK